MADLVTAFGVTAVHFDPTQIEVEAVEAWLNNEAAGPSEAAPPRSVELPVLYGGEAGIDLAAVAEQAGLSIDEAIRRHAGAAYTVGAIGFQPGFPYLEGLPPELRTPRHDTPRTHVPPGSVGIGGEYTGVYPRESPGGWNLIGRTPVALFDAHRDEPSLLRAGDHVRFRPIDAAEFDRLAAENQPHPPPRPAPLERPIFRVISPGVQTTVQGLGRFGRQHFGVSPGGAMDTTSLRIANLLVGNRDDAPALEATLVGPVLECLEPVTIGVSGAVPAAAPRRLTRGQQLDLRELVGGARAYVSVPGGFAGAIDGKLSTGDLLGSLDPSARDRTPQSLSGRSLPTAAWLLGGGDSVTLRILRGPQADHFDRSAWNRFLSEPWRVSPRSSRMGVRLEGGRGLTPDGLEGVASQPVCTGCVQVPPDGRPIVLGADRQTLGGYPVIAVVASVDWPRLGQLRPGDTVRFAEVDLPTARAARRRAERDLAIAAQGFQLLH